MIQTFISFVLVLVSIEVSAVNSNDGMAWLGYREGKFITKETVSGPFVAHTVQLLCPASNCKDTVITNLFTLSVKFI